MYFRFLHFCKLAVDWKNLDKIDINQFAVLLSLYKLVPQISYSFMNLAMAYERYVFICRAHEADSILSKRWRVIVYSMVSIVPFAVVLGIHYSFKAVPVQHAIAGFS